MFDRVEKFDDGFVVLGDSTTDNALESSLELLGGKIPLIIADPPYGNIVNEHWDRIDSDDNVFANWMKTWTELWAQALIDGGAMYVWGGLGRPGFRPFMKYICQVEQPGCFELANLITWSKKRAYGVSHNYLWTREECAYFVKGPAKKPAVFNIPLLETKRDYAGFNSKYPAKSEFYRRTNVWTDVNEIFRGKLHPTQKQQRVIEIPIEVHTAPGDFVLDPFAGAGTTAFAARKLGRKFLIIEREEKYFDEVVQRLKTGGISNG
jgi:site-specific DNA-methyltransferase (adenine-specific)